MISTGQFFGEGTDINNLECLFIVYPFAFEGKLVQYIYTFAFQMDWIYKSQRWIVTYIPMLLRGIWYPKNLPKNRLLLCMPVKHICKAEQSKFRKRVKFHFRTWKNYYSYQYYQVNPDNTVIKDYFFNNSLKY